ncbi:MAG: zinc-ribbon domain-containing protein [Selenomonadaceae bacterium]|nr:zinc-ribbon domain-containing protein [Selenomonadaceae bacterium]
MAVNFCSNCGAKLREGAKFCGSCGQKIQYDPPKPMPSKNIMEIYAKSKAKLSSHKVDLQKTAPPKSVAEMFAEAKKNSQIEQTAPWMKSPPPQPKSEMFAETKKNSQAEQSAPWMKSPPPQPKYTPPPKVSPPPEDTTPRYKENETITEMFFSTKGVLGRSEFLKRSFIIWIVEFLFALILISSGGRGDPSPGALLFFLFIMLVSVVAVYCLSVRRLKDMGKDESSAKGLAVLVILFAPLSFAFLLASNKNFR